MDLGITRRGSASHTMAARFTTAALLLLAPVFGGRARAADNTDAQLEQTFSSTVRPFLDRYCTECHAGDKATAQLDFRRYTTLSSVIEDHRRWSLVREKLSAKQMPPEAMPQPAPEARAAVIAWFDELLKNETRKNAGDPGVVLARRLSNAEYNYSIRDLTGVDIRPTREFPVDPANPAGFDNSGESLAMSPTLLAKYLQAAREVANHMVLLPDGITFAPHLVLVETDRDKYSVQRIVDFYRRQDTDYADYFQAAWQYKYRTQLGRSKTNLADLARTNKVSPKYLATIWHTLEETPETIGPLARLQAMWRQLPVPNRDQPGLARAGSVGMREFVVQLRHKIELRFPDLSVRGINRTAQPFLIWRNRLYATHRLDFDRAALEVAGETRRSGAETAGEKVTEDNADEGPVAAQPIKRQPGDPDLQVPAGGRQRYEEAFARFSAVFPDAFYISERGRYFPDNTRDTGRLLSAGFHNLMGYFRDDKPLYDLVLDDPGRKELDELWRELDFVASANIRTWVQFYLFETRETAKGPQASGAEDKEITSAARINRVRDSYLTRARAAGNETAIKAIEEFFTSVNDGIRWVEHARIAAEPSHLKALQDFAARAYRRPLTESERSDLLGYYRSLREKDGLSHEDAMRDAVVSVLMSPDFCYRIDLVAAARPQAPAGSASIRPLSDYALASRLSYFLWSSIPDSELLTHAASGDLHQPEVIAGQARRMLKDARALGLATEFGGNWLDFRRFEEHNAVDRERFPEFTNDLREAMFQEPIRLIADVIRNDRSILDLLYGGRTLVNPVLAKHYGMPLREGTAEEWIAVDDARKYGRGGLLPMAVFLTKNAPGLRTSPVKRGYWVVKRVLGEEIPPPPAMVPELPRDEAKLDLPLREMLAKHRQDPSCASCHSRFDSFGLAFEGYGPVGEVRTKDLAGHPVDAQATFPGGLDGAGLDGILEYIRSKRQNDYVNNLSRKMLVYALGRSLILSDEPLIEQMNTGLAAKQYHFSSLVEAIVTSKQFLTKRGPDVSR